MNDLEILYPTHKRIRVGRRWVTIRPIEFKYFSDFGQAASELLLVLAKGDATQIYTWAKRSGVLRAILVNCTNLSKWRVDRLPVVVGVELMLHVIAMNSRFFDQALVNTAQLLAGETSPKI